MDNEHNPFAPPQADMQPLGIVTGFENEPEAIRRRFLNHESAVWTIGWLYLAGAALMCVGAIGAASLAFSGDKPFQEMAEGHEKTAFLTGYFISLVLLVLIPAVIGVGLVRLNNAARIAGIIVAALLLIVGVLQLNVVILVVQGVFLYYLVTAKGRYVCSAEYREIIYQTPRIKRRKWVLIVLAVLVGFFVLSLLAFLFLPIVLHLTS